MNSKRIFLIPVLLFLSLVFSSFDNATYPDTYRAIALLKQLNGEWNFQAWWKIKMVVANGLEDSEAQFYLYCLNTDESMEGKLKYNETMEKLFENRLGGTWRFNVSTTGQDSGLIGAVYDD